MVSRPRGTGKRMRALPAVLPMVVVLVTTGMVAAETMSDCINTGINQRGTARKVLDREGAACRGDRQCVKDAEAKFNMARKQINDAESACVAQVRSQMNTEPPPYLHWKPGDPSPRAKDGRLYIMSCSGKPLGLYKPGGALEVEMKTHPGNSVPSEEIWPGPGVGGPGTSSTNHCYELGTGSYKEYTGGKPSWCDPTR
jgi:hypothetical protein